MMPISIYIFILLELLVVSFYDLKTRKISNYWSVLNIIIFIIFIILFPQTYRLDWGTVFYSLAIFVAGFGFFVVKIMGGGDAKFLASLYLLIPQKLQESSFVSLIYSTLLIGGGILIYKLWNKRSILKVALITQDYKKIRELMGKKFPFSPVVLIAWIIWGISYFLNLKFL